MKVVRYYETGGPEVLRWEDVDLKKPGAGEVQIRLSAIGLNFIEINTRAGRWGFKPPHFPYIPGLEGAGVITEVGSGVTDLSPGDRVCFASGGGEQSYAESVVIDSAGAIPIPNSISDRDAAAIIFKGLTAYMLVKQIREPRPGETVLVHGATGGIEYVVCQWAKHLGAHVIGTVGSDHKAQFAKSHGCDLVINYSTEDFSQRVMDMTKGRGVDVVYDGVGQAVLEGSLASLAVRGMMINYGQTSGPSLSCDIEVLGDKSLYFTRPKLHDYIVEKETRLEAAKMVFGLVEAGHLKIEVGSSFPLREAVEAHRERERRSVMGSMLLVP